MMTKHVSMGSPTVTEQAFLGRKNKQPLKYVPFPPFLAASHFFNRMYLRTHTEGCLGSLDDVTKTAGCSCKGKKSACVQLVPRFELDPLL